MAKEFSFDIVSEFDFQELRNAVDQVKKELSNRYDFKGSKFEIDLKEDEISLKAEDDMKISAMAQTLSQRVSARKISPKILQFGDIDHSLGGSIKQTVTLIKSLDTDTAKKISKEVRNEFSKIAKASIQGEAVRITSKSKDHLQKVIQHFKETEDLDVPLVFNNFR